MKIGFYGSIGERLGREAELELPAEGCTVAELRRLLVRAHPDWAAELSRPSLRACVDDVVVSEEHPVGILNRVEFFPPLSGG